MKLSVICSDAASAIHVGGNVEITARTFDLPPEAIEYIRSLRDPKMYCSIMLAIDETDEQK